MAATYASEHGSDTVLGLLMGASYCLDMEKTLGHIHLPKQESLWYKIETNSLTVLERGGAPGSNSPSPFRIVPDSLTPKRGEVSSTNQLTPINSYSIKKRIKIAKVPLGS